MFFINHTLQFNYQPGSLKVKLVHEGYLHLLCTYTIIAINISVSDQAKCVCVCVGARRNVHCFYEVHIYCE
jgi:hypothetical protein